MEGYRSVLLFLITMRDIYLFVFCMGSGFPKQKIASAEMRSF